jgi:3-oxoadipate enol-lactonase
MPLLTTSSTTTYYRFDGGDGLPVLMLSHSLGQDHSMWDAQARALSSRFRVLRYDTRGHGGTDAPAGDYTLAQLAQDAKALLGALGIARTHWIGLSMGGMIGQTLALSSPGLFQSLGLCDTSSRIPAEAGPVWQERIKTARTQGMDSLVEPTIGRWFTAPFVAAHKDVVDPVRTRIRTTSPQGYAGCCAALSQLDLTDRISAIKVPTLIVVGEEDQGTPVAASRAIQAQIAGSQLEIIKSAAHLSNLEQPAEFTRILTTFLARVA